METKRADSSSKESPEQKLKRDMKNYRFSLKEELNFDEEEEDIDEPEESQPQLTREEQEKEAKHTRNELIFGIILLQFVLQLAGNLILWFSLRFTVGALLGGCVAIMLVSLMLHSIYVSADYEKKSATRYMRRSYFLRLLIMLAVIGGSLYLLALPGFFGAILGILTLKFSAMLWPLMHEKKFIQRFFSKKSES